MISNGNHYTTNPIISFGTSQSKIKLCNKKLVHVQESIYTFIRFSRFASSGKRKIPITKKQKNTAIISNTQ